MSNAANKPDLVERAETDASLRNERDQTDERLAQRRAALETEADRVVERARDNADAVLEAARQAADRKLEAGPAAAPSVGEVVVERERAAEDEHLRRERAAEDERLRRERHDLARRWASLLPSERNETDQRLLTERRRADSEVTNRDDFLGIVSHDLRNLLGGIVLGAELIAQEVDSTPEARRVVTARIGRYASRMTRLIGDLQDVGSIEAGRLAVTRRPTDLVELVTEAVEAFAASARAKRVELTLAPSAGPLIAELDAGRILQVVSNLLANAIKFTPAGGHVVVECAREAESVRCNVIDSGEGIAPDQLEQIFDRFWQVSPGERQGLGLGLYISRCLVEAHQGRIWAESGPGEGSRLSFTVPVA